METRAHYVAVGAFVLTMVILAFVAVLWLARGALNTEYAHYDIFFEGPVTGLRTAAEVTYKGVPVGKVTDIKIVDIKAVPSSVQRPGPGDTEGSEGQRFPDDRMATMIRVTVDIDPAVAIKTNARATVESNILSGVAYIQIVGGTSDAPLLRPQPDERYAVIRARRSGFASVTARVPQLLEKLTDTADRLNELLDDRNRKALSDSLENLRVFSGGLAARNQDIAELTGNAKTAAADLSRLIGNLDRSYSGPDGLGEKLSAAIGDFDRVAKNLNDTNQQLQGAVRDVRPGLRNFSQQTLGDVGSLVAEARQLVSGLNRVAAGLERDPSRALFGDRREGYRPK